MGILRTAERHDFDAGHYRRFLDVDPRGGGGEELDSEDLSDRYDGAGGPVSAAASKKALPDEAKYTASRRRYMSYRSKDTLSSFTRLIYFFCATGLQGWR